MIDSGELTFYLSLIRLQVFRNYFYSCQCNMFDCELLVVGNLQ